MEKGICVIFHVGWRWGGGQVRRVCMALGLGMGMGVTVWFRRVAAYHTRGRRVYGMFWAEGGGWDTEIASTVGSRSHSIVYCVYILSRLTQKLHVLVPANPGSSPSLSPGIVCWGPVSCVPSVLICVRDALVCSRDCIHYSAAWDAEWSVPRVVEVGSWKEGGMHMHTHARIRTWQAVITQCR
jgi:hypothetical protein